MASMKQIPGGGGLIISVDFICYTDNARYGTGDKKHDLRDLYCRLDRYGACRTGGDDPFKRNRSFIGGKDRWYIGHSDFV